MDTMNSDNPSLNVNAGDGERAPLLGSGQERERIEREKELFSRARLGPARGTEREQERSRLAYYCIFFLHGVGHLLPWNFFTTAQLVRQHPN